jgi:hypothetical protein
MFVTALLILMIFMLAVEKTKSTFVAPVGIGLTLFAGHLAAVYWTGAGLNPARSFGPEVVIGNFPGYHWIYCINHRWKRLFNVRGRSEFGRSGVDRVVYDIENTQLRGCQWNGRSR